MRKMISWLALNFLERRRASLGEYFLNSLYSDTDSFAAALARKGCGSRYDIRT
jgi:hypothetical protein